MSSDLTTMAKEDDTSHKITISKLYLVVATLVCIIQGLMIYCVQFPISLEPILISVMNMDYSQYNAIFSAYTWCDIVMSIVGSILVNKYLGVRFGLVLFTTIFMFGQVLISIGAYYNSFSGVLLGRFILGLGKGTAASAGYSYKIKEYTGNKLTFLLSLGRCFTRVMSILALFTPVSMYNVLNSIRSSPHRHGAVQMVAMSACVFCVVLSIIVAIVDNYRTKRCVRMIDEDDEENFNISEACNFPIAFWMVAIICGLYHAVAFPSIVNAPLFFISKYHYSLLNANLVNALSYTVSIFAIPSIAISIDFFGYNLIFALIGVILAVISNLFYIFSDCNNYIIPIVAAVINSFGYAFFGTAAMWIMISYIVPGNQLTTACGIQMSLFAIFTSLTSFISGIILDYHGFLLLYIFYYILLFIIICIIVLLAVLEFSKPENRVLNVAGKTRRGSEKFFPF